MPPQSFVTQFPILVLTRPITNPPSDWQEVDHGPGYIQLPEGVQVGIRARTLDDADLKALVTEVKPIPGLVYLNLSENRRISGEGLESLRHLPELQILNLSSADLTNQALEGLLPLNHLAHLDLSFCNRITDLAFRTLRQLPALDYLNLQGCVKITHGGVARIQKRGLTIRS